MQQGRLYATIMLTTMGLICTSGGLLAAGEKPVGVRQTTNTMMKQPAPASEYTLRLGEQSFDPLVEAPALPAGWATSRSVGDDLRLVQFRGPIDSRWVNDLEQSGMKVIQYIHPYTYIVWGSSQGRDAVLNHEAVRWTGDFAPAYRVLPNFRNLPDQPVDVHVLLYRGADTNQVVRELEALGARSTSRRILDHRFEVAGFTLSGAKFQEAAQIAGVYSIQPVPTDGGPRGEMTNQINAGNYNASNQAFPGYLSYLNGLGITGQGVIIANVDSGVNVNHPDLVNRIVPCSGTSCSTTSSSHGTHTAGIMAADGSSGTTDNFGFLRGLGVAPGANLVVQRYSGIYTQPGGMLLLMTVSYNNGASVSGNSWGPSGSALGYDNHTMQVDIGVRDADPNTPGNQPLTYVLSFMNGYGGTSSQGTPDEAKNIFTIGSTKAQNSGSGSQILQIDDLSSNSAHGPARDGRTIPHMVAPGCYVDSSDTTGSGYGLNCGTSMASPHVSGAVALFIEYYRNLPDYSVDPSPAMVKAAFLPVAHSLAGHLDADGGVLGHPFDSKQGWGRMDLDAVINPPANSVRYFDNPVIFDNTGEEWSTTVSPLDPSKPMKIMLVWTDAPGHGLGGSTPAWNNNLDLIVETQAGTYRGNNFGSNGYSVTGGSADTRNNTEGVFLAPNTVQSATIRVLAANINSDGVPNHGDGTDQDFAVACYNCAVEPGFTIAAVPTSETICAPSEASYVIELGQILSFDETVTLSASGAPGATISFSSSQIVPPGSATMTVSNTGAVAAGNHTIQVTGTSASLTRSVNVQLNVSTAAPGAVALTAPTNGQTGVAVVPMLAWNAASQAAEYEVQVATNSSFSNIVYSATTSETSHTVETSLDTDTMYYWRVRASNTCGTGAFSNTYSFRTLDVPPILLVDDDDNSPNVRSYYTAALDALGVQYDIFDTNNNAVEPTLAQLSGYKIIIWFSGDSFGGSSNPKAGPKPATESILASWLDAGGVLFLSSQDYLYDRIGFGGTAPNTFMANYLGVGAPLGQDVSQSSVTGQNVFAGYGSYTLSYPFSNYSDRIVPNGNAALAFMGNQGGAGVSMDGGHYRTVFFGFPWEAIGNASDRQAVMQRVIEWGSELFSEPCQGDVAPPGGDGVVNVDDLLAVIGSWGPCAGCDADVDGNNVINVDDLLSVIGAWGTCQ